MGTDTSGMATRPARWGPWTTLFWGVGCGLVMVVSQTAGAVAFALWWRYAHPEQPLRIENLGSNGSAITLALLVSTPFVLGFIALAVRLANADFAEYLPLQQPKVRDIGIGVAALASVLVIAGGAELFLDVKDPAFLFETYATARR